ncbi:hypothetical protein RGCCGE502_10886 [Rhizobium grahamii CCGE 502]|uniref:Uncharacterized protein n=1 Tax=Rhizobium grahamii CCGE 502 TaxID=990285 RepID=S3HH74_9HYPH|nr:hypothetical protein RGCCGE502_10886 [Rhizobium grahamii CCGE 502]
MVLPLVFFFWTAAEQGGAGRCLGAILKPFFEELQLESQGARRTVNYGEDEQCRTATFIPG